MKLKVLKIIQFIVVCLLTLIIGYNILKEVYSYISTQEDYIIIGVIAIVFLTVVSFVLHLFNRSKAIDKIIAFIELKVEENHISKEFYDNSIFPVIMEMQKPFTLRKPTIENYFDKRIITQYLS